MKYIRLFESFDSYDPYELMMIPPYKKTEMIIEEIKKGGKANLNLVSDLITLGADLELIDKYDKTVLHVCASNNEPEILRMLIDAGADVNQKYNNGSTALHDCARLNYPEIARILIDAGADVNDQNNYDYTPLHYCTYPIDSIELTQMLIDAGADKTIPNDNGRLPYELADSQELKELLKP